MPERLTNVPGSSEVFGYGFVTYAEAAKQKLLGVPAETIAQYNVVSGPVAAAMAFGAAKESGAELAVGITGLAGPGGELPGKSVGTVYLAGADARTNTGCLMRLTLAAIASAVSSAPAPPCTRWICCAAWRWVCLCRTAWPSPRIPRPQQWIFD